MCLRVIDTVGDGVCQTVFFVCPYVGRFGLGLLAFSQKGSKNLRPFPTFYQPEKPPSFDLFSGIGGWPGWSGRPGGGRLQPHGSDGAVALPPYCRLRKAAPLGKGLPATTSRRVLRWEWGQSFPLDKATGGTGLWQFPCKSSADRLQTMRVLNPPAWRGLLHWPLCSPSAHFFERFGAG